MKDNQNNPEIWMQRWPAPAKLNLMLRIVGRRADGYHLLQTVFQFIEICDWLQFHPVENDEVGLVRTLPGVDEADDLTVRAAKLLKDYAGVKNGVRIEIEKNLPMGGGLGGGSSDAATTLVVLDKLWDLRLSKQQLMDLGLKLGADVPVFIHGYSSWGEGVGEKLVSVTLPETWVIIIKPDCHIETRAIFCAEDLTRDSKSIKMSDFMEGDQKNDCLATVCKRYPLVQEAMSALSEFSETRLTGTGACVFALFNSEEDAQSAYNKLSKSWQTYLTRSKNESPLFERLKTLF